MKKITFAAAALLVLAGSTFATTSVSNQTSVAKVTNKTTVSHIVPGCSPNDPNGCGIFD